jgi:A/G-specific adenine glycosylase
VSVRGAFPDTLHGLLELPGVGPYTARAVLAFAFEADAAVVDTNIARIYARVGGRTLRAREVQSIADAHAPLGESWAWNQSIMELGAIVCRPVPGCVRCPVADRCAWRGSGGDDPAVGSAGVSARQAPFVGSDRQARGRLIRAATEGPVRVQQLAAVTGRIAGEAERLAAALVAEGLLVRDGPVLRLPDQDCGISRRDQQPADGRSSPVGA